MRYSLAMEDPPSGKYLSIMNIWLGPRISFNYIVTFIENELSLEELHIDV